MWLSLVEIFSDLRVNEENVETFRGWINAPCKLSRSCPDVIGVGPPKFWMYILIPVPRLNVWQSSVEFRSVTSEEKQTILAQYNGPICIRMGARNKLYSTAA